MNWVVNNLDLIGGLTLAHLRQSAIAIVAAFVIALPLGWVAWRYTALRGSVLTTIGLLYTIPLTTERTHPAKLTVSSQARWLVN